MQCPMVKDGGLGSWGVAKNDSPFIHADIFYMLQLVQNHKANNIIERKRFDQKHMLTSVLFVFSTGLIIGQLSYVQTTSKPS